MDNGRGCLFTGTSLLLPFDQWTTIDLLPSTTSGLLCVDWKVRRMWTVTYKSYWDVFVAGWRMQISCWKLRRYTGRLERKRKQMFRSEETFWLDKIHLLEKRSRRATLFRHRIWWQSDLPKYSFNLIHELPIITERHSLGLGSSRGHSNFPRPFIRLD